MLFGKELMMIFAFERKENHVETEVNAGNQHFLLFSQCFQNPYLSGVL